MERQWDASIDALSELYDAIKKKFPIASNDMLYQMASAVLISARGEMARTFEARLTDTGPDDSAKGVVFSAEGAGHVSEGAPVLLEYKATHANRGDAWSERSTFDAPFTGVYVFILTFVKDATDHGGTKDDVRIIIRKNGENLGAAWSGVSEGPRSTAAYSVAFPLNAGDKIQTFAESDAGRKRHIASYQLTGYQVPCGEAGSLTKYAR